MPTSFTHVKDLIEIVTTIIFICGLQHSAVNYTQDDYMAFAANMPLAAYRDIPKQSRKPEQTTPDSNLPKVTKKQQTTSSKAMAIAATPNQAVAAQDAKTETITIEIVEEQITEVEILKLLPPFQKAADQLQTAFFLSAYRYDRLGYYDKSFQELYNQKLEEVFKGNSAIINIVMQFQQNLNMAEQEIDNRNRQRVVPYPYLKPSLILNSISI
jgi:arachidonate 15-lipoxygenase